MLCWIACGTILGNKFWSTFLRRFVTANHRRDSAPKTIPWCNLTQNRPLHTLYLKVAYSMDEQSGHECECGARGGGGGGTDLRAWTDLTCLFISPLWWRTSSRGKRTWRISVRVILSHARCSICTGSRLNVNWMSNFFLFIYGILENIMGKNVSRQLSSLSP